MERVSRPSVGWGWSLPCTVALTACGRGTYGINCSESCSCERGATCHSATGQCLCPVGWTGDQCAEPCDRGQYGPNCSLSCQCHNGADCDPVTGCCHCTPGWYGAHCQLGASISSILFNILSFITCMLYNCLEWFISEWHLDRVSSRFVITKTETKLQNLLIYFQPCLLVIPLVVLGCQIPNLLIIQYICTLFGARSFNVVPAFTIWNSPPSALQMCTSPDTFRHHLKTHYFQQTFQPT